MPLITGVQLLERFVELAEEAERIDIAVAWASSCNAIDALAESNANVRAVVGTSGNSTNPTTLRRLTEFSQLRISPNNPPRIFHPKYYCFHGRESVCWVGSANLTAGGFGGNVELVHEFKLKNEGDRNWFEYLWASLEDDPWSAIWEYEARYTPPQRGPQPAGPYHDHDLPSLADVVTWADFVEGLQAYHESYRYHDYNFDVFGASHSWLHTIRTGHEIICLNDWNNLTQRECRILRGFAANDDNEGEWGLLGWVRGGGAYVFNPENMPEVEFIRMQIQEQLVQVLGAGPDEITAVATNAMNTIRQLQHLEGADRGIGHAAATRWLALARPDCLVSVNGASAAGLGVASGLANESARLADVYDDLISWLHNRPWFNEYNGQQPEDPLEQDLWRRRAALVDVFVYDA